MAGADIILIKKEFVASSLPGSEGSASEESEEDQLEAISQKINKESGPLFGSSTGQRGSQLSVTATKFAVWINEIKYATSGDD